MNEGPVLSPKVLRNLRALGETGAVWLAALPRRVEDLQRQWNVIVGETMPNTTEAYVAETVSVAGEPGVLKVPIPGSDKARRELYVLRAANGSGYARVLSYDPVSGAMLLERLGPQLAALGYSIEKQIAVICDTLRRAWRPAPLHLLLMTGAEKADALAGTIRSVTHRHPGVCSARTIEVALRFAKQRRDAFDPKTCVLGHGDAHCWNALHDPNTNGFKFVDPDGLFIERAHDLSISLREWSKDILAGDVVARGRARCDYIAGLTGVAHLSIWEWGLIENLVNGLLYIDVGSRADAEPFLAVATAWAASETN